MRLEMDYAKSKQSWGFSTHSALTRIVSKFKLDDETSEMVPSGWGGGGGVPIDINNNNNNNTLYLDTKIQSTNSVR